jgi:hypothetical protein
LGPFHFIISHHRKATRQTKTIVRSIWTDFPVCLARAEKPVQREQGGHNEKQNGDE